MTITLNALQKQRRDTASNWTSNNTVLLAGEWGIESDTKKFKIGDGSTAWQSLDYVPIPDINRSLSGNLTVEGNFTVNGTTTTIDTTTLTVEDKNIEIGKVSSPSDTTADGGGLSLLGTTTKTINWVNSTDSWTLSEHLDLASGKVLKIGGTQILSGTQYTGNSATATALATARTIAGTSFDGTTNIDISYQNLTNKLSVGDGGLTQNNFTDALKNKLDGIATGATNITNNNQITNGANYVTSSIINSLNASNLTSGTIPDARFPSTLPAINGSNLTGISFDLVSDTSPTLGGDLATNSNDIVFADADKAIFGAGSDLEIFSDGSTCFLKSDDLRIRSAGNENYLTCAANGAVQIFYDNSLRFETTANGIEVEGSGTDAIIANFKAALGSNNRNLSIKSPASDSTTLPFLFSTSNSIGFEVDNVECFRIGSADDISIPNDSSKLTFGSNQDLQVFHDGTDSFIQNSTGQLTLRVASVEAAVNCIPNGSVELYHDGSKKFETTSSGINITDGGVHVQIESTTSGSSARLSIKSTDSTYTGLHFGDDADLDVGRIRYYHTSDSMLFYTVASERMRIDSSGNVGIGVTSIDSALHVYKQTNDRTARFQRISSQHIDITQTSGINSFTSTGKNFAIGTTDSKILIFDTNGSERMRIDSSGRIGINTTSSSYPLEVNGTVRTVGTNNLPALVVDGNSTNEGDIAVADGQTLTFGHHTLDGNTGSFTERMRIRSNGTVLIGTTSSSNTDNKLEVRNSSAGGALGVTSSNSSSQQDFILFKRGSGNTDNGGIRRDGSTNGVELFSGSDRRIKTNIENMDNVLDKINQLSLKKFDFKQGGSGIGLIAQELINIFPNKVKKDASDDGTGDNVPDGVEPWTVGHNFTYEILKAIQELTARVEALETA